jgi:hypothetical protein
MSPTALRPLGIGETLDVAIKLCLANLATLAKVVLVIVAPIAAVSEVVTVSSTPDFDSFDPAAGEFDADEFWTFLAGIGTVTLLSALGAILATGACFKAITDAYLGRPVAWRESIAFAARRFGSILWVSILVGLLTVLGMIACLVPGVWLWFSFAVAVPVLLTEDLRGRKALGRSKRLVAGRWWSVTAAIFVSLLLAGILQGALTAVASAVSLTSAGTLASSLVNFLATTVASALTTPFTAAVAIVVYIDLRVRKEAFDLELLAEQIGVDPPEGGWPASSAAPIAAGAPAGEQPPYSPPPPGWTPGSATPAQSQPATPSTDQPPFWPPPPGWQPGAPAAPDRLEAPTDVGLGSGEPLLRPPRRTEDPDEPGDGESHERPDGA